MIRFLKPEIPRFEKIAEYLEDSKEQNWFSNFGPAHQKLQQKLKAYTGWSNEPVLVNNATSGLIVAIKALGLEGSKILVPDFTFCASAHAVLEAGATPIIYPTPGGHLKVPLEKAAKLKEEGVEAIMPVYCLSDKPDFGHFEELKEKFGFKILYDAAAAFGIKENGKHVGETGDAHVFSTHITKSFGIGEGGIISSLNQEFLDLCKIISNFGLVGDTVIRSGLNAKMPDIVAAVGCATLDNFDEDLKNKQQVIDWYEEALEPLIKKEYIQYFCKKNLPAMQSLPIRFRIGARDDKMEWLKKAGVETKIYYRPLSENIYFFKHLISQASFPGFLTSRQLFESILCLPLYSSLTKKEVEKVVAEISHDLP